MLFSVKKYMKSIVPTDINNMAVGHKIQSPVLSSTEKADAALPSFWFSLPFLLAAFIHGLPIGGGLQVQGTRWAESIYESTQARATTLGYENTIVYALVCGSAGACPRGWGRGVVGIETNVSLKGACPRKTFCN